MLEVIFSVVVFVIFVNVIVILFLVSFFYDLVLSKYVGYKSWNLMYLKFDVELWVFVCIYWFENVLVMIDLFDFMCFMMESFSVIYVFYLIELMVCDLLVFMVYYKYEININVGGFFEDIFVFY